MKRTLLLLLGLVYLLAIAGCVPPPPPNDPYRNTTVNVNHNYHRDVHRNVHRERHVDHRTPHRDNGRHVDQRRKYHQ